MELYQGYLGEFGFWGAVVFLLIFAQMTIFTVTVYLHRGIAHRALEFKPVMEHIFRFWLWMSTGMVPKEWAAIHRCHHAKVETEEDPHSPQRKGIAHVLFMGVYDYIKVREDKEMIEKYGFGTPDDWIEHKLYRKHRFLGLFMLLGIYIALMGLVPGAIIWILHMAWIPFWAAGVINGIGHYWGYRNFQPEDESRNITPIAFFIGGEELHNNHHAFPTSARFSNRWYEFDIGWQFICLLEKLHLLKVKRVSPRLLTKSNSWQCDLDTVNAIIANRFEVITRFANAVKGVMHEEWRLAKKIGKDQLPARRSIRNLCLNMKSRLSESETNKLKGFLHTSKVAAQIETMRHGLYEIWEAHYGNSGELVERLRQWCKQADESGIEVLRKFAQDLRGYNTNIKVISS